MIEVSLFTPKMRALAQDHPSYKTYESYGAQIATQIVSMKILGDWLTENIKTQWTIAPSLYLPEGNITEAPMYVVQFESDSDGLLFKLMFV